VVAGMKTNFDIKKKMRDEIYDKLVAEKLAAPTDLNLEFAKKNTNFSKLVQKSSLHKFNQAVKRVQGLTLTNQSFEETETLATLPNITTKPSHHNATMVTLATLQSDVETPTHYHPLESLGNKGKSCLHRTIPRARESDSRTTIRPNSLKLSGQFDYIEITSPTNIHVSKRLPGRGSIDEYKFDFGSEIDAKCHKLAKARAFQLGFGEDLNPLYKKKESNTTDTFLNKLYTHKVKVDSLNKAIMQDTPFYTSSGETKITPTPRNLSNIEAKLINMTHSHTSSHLSSQFKMPFLPNSDYALESMDLRSMKPESRETLLPTKPTDSSLTASPTKHKLVVFGNHRTKSNHENKVMRLDTSLSPLPLISSNATTTTSTTAKWEKPNKDFYSQLIKRSQHRFKLAGARLK
jgi:hypothetical protein